MSYARDVHHFYREFYLATEDMSDNGTSDEDRLAVLEAIYMLMTEAGYEATRETAKLAEFVSPTGNVIYVEKIRAHFNSIKCCVHPDHARESLLALDGVERVSDDHRFHSNMIRFPKRLHGGQTPTAFGWQIKIDTMLGLHEFLRAFARLEGGAKTRL